MIYKNDIDAFLSWHLCRSLMTFIAALRNYLANNLLKRDLSRAALFL